MGKGIRLISPSAKPTVNIQPKPAPTYQIHMMIELLEDCEISDSDAIKDKEKASLECMKGKTEGVSSCFALIQEKAQSATNSMQVT